MPVEPTLPFAMLLSFLLVLARVSAAFVFVPIPGFRNAPEVPRIVLALGVTAALFPVWPAPPVESPGIGRLAAWLAAEAAFGIAVGLAVAFLTESLVLAAQVLGLQAGFSYASTIDPTSQADSSVLQVLSHLTGSLLFFALGVDRMVLRVFAASFETFPPGGYVLNPSWAEAMIRLGSDMFNTAVRLAMPVVALLFLVDLTLALLGRINSQLQLLTLAFPAKMIAALALLAVLARIFPVLFGGAAQRTVTALMNLVRI